MKINELIYQQPAKSPVEKTNKSSDLIKEERLKQSAKNMEALFLGFMLKAMEKTIPESEGSSNNFAKMMFSEVMGQALAEQGGIGLADFLARTWNQQDANLLEKIKTEIQKDGIYQFNGMRGQNE